MFNESKNIEMKYSFKFSSFHRKKTFDKIADVLKRSEPPTMSQLGLEFLRAYDGKFNYREGHRVCDSIFVYQVEICLLI
jgi:hypothetical protein